MSDRDFAEIQQIVRSALRGLARDLVENWTQDIVGDVWRKYGWKPQAERCNLARRCARNRRAHHLRDGYQEGLRRALDRRPEARGDAVVPGAADGETIPAPDIAIVQRQADSLQAQVVRTVMRRLKKENPRYWDVLYLQCWFGLSQAEIAYVLCVKVVDVNNWQKRGRARLLELLMRARKESGDV